jgi:hypothetical protein
MVLLLLVTVLSAFGLAAQAWGVDSRDFSLDGRDPAGRPGLG